MEEKVEVRVVALQGAAVEALCALELQHLLVGRSHDCTNPSQIQSLPCVSSIYPEDQSPLDFDFKEQGFIHKALAPFEINLKLLRELKPDVIITQDRCDACGGRLDELQKACGSFIFGDDKRCGILSLKPLMIEDIFQDIESIANVCNSSKKGKNLVSNLRTRWKHARQRTPQWADGVPFINVACLQWLEPLIGAGHWIPEIVECAGGFNMFGDAGHHSPVISWPEFMHMDPDVIIIVCIGLNIERASCALASVQNSNDWRQLRAVIAKRVYIVNGERYFNLPGPAVVDSAELMVEILHGVDNKLAYVYQGTGYVRWEVKDSIEHSTRLQELHTLAQRLDQGTVVAEVLEDRCTGRHRILEDCLLAKEVQSGQVNFFSHLHSDSDSTVSSEYRRRFVAHSRKGNRKDYFSKGGYDGFMSKSFTEHNSVNNGSKIDSNDSGRRNSLASISLKGSNPSALKAGEIGQQYSRHSLHSSLSDQNLPFLHEGRFADAADGNSAKMSSMKVPDYTAIPSLKIDISPSHDEPTPVCIDNPFAKQSCETTPSKGSPFFAVKSSNARNSCESISNSTSSRRPSVTDSEKEVLSRMWASTEAAAKCQSPEGAKSSVDCKKRLHKKSKDPQNFSNMIMGSPVSKLVLGTDLHAGKMFEGVENKFPTFANCKIKDSQVGLPLRKKQMGGSCNDSNVVSKNSDLGLHNSKSSSFCQKALALKTLIFEAVKELPLTDCLLLSGGLGSTILAEAAQLAFPKSYKTGVTVLVGPDAKDKHFSQLVSKEYDMKHIIVGGGDKGNPVDLLEKHLDFVVETLGTFNPSEVQRSVALATALREVKRLGFSSVVTGDGVDELFAGHHCMHSMSEDEFYKHRHQLISSMTYSSVFLGSALGIKVLQPYLNPKVVEFATELSKVDLMGPKDGKLHDKIFLRHAFSEVLTARRSKDPIEVGSGTFVLSEYFARQVSWAQFKSEARRIFREDHVQIKDPEQLAYYLAFQRIFQNHSPPGMIRWGSDPCVDCGYNVDLAQRTYCLTCGHHSDRTKTSSKLSVNFQSPKELHNQPKQSNSSVVHQVLRPMSRLEHCLSKTLQESPANKYCNTVYPNPKSKETSADKSADVRTDRGTLNGDDDDDDDVGDVDACKSPVAGLQGIHNFEHPNAGSEVRNQKRWFWELAAGITGLVILLRLRIKRAGS